MALEHFVTLFDVKFLPQGVALHTSMMRFIPSFQLWIICLDEIVYSALQQIDLPNVCLLRLRDYETRDLLRIKPERSIAEYCWTLTPFAPRFVFEIDSSISRVTYIDADLWFMKNPRAIFREFDASNKHVMITSHGFSPEYDQSRESGQYCVQFMIFANTSESERVRKSWEVQCIDWCFARQEDGKFGDQKYLDVWPNQFNKQVHVMKNFGWALAPWNSTRFPYGEAIFNHFQGFRLVSQSKYSLGHYAIPKPTFENVYQPYFLDIKNVLNRMHEEGIDFYSQDVEREVSTLKLYKTIVLDLLKFRWRYSPSTIGRL